MLMIYIEPVVFRQDPALVETWMNWTLAIARAHASTPVALCANPWMCDRAVGAGFAGPTVRLSERRLLEPFGLERGRYAHGLMHANAADPCWDAAVEATHGAIQPDAVLSFSPAPWLARAFGAARIFFSEISPLCRLAAPAAFFLDSLGHQRASILDRFAGRILEHPGPLTAAAARACLERRRDIVLGLPAAAAALATWLDGLPKGRPRVLLATQPPDWMTYTGLAGDLPVETLIARTAIRFDDAIVIPTFHAASRLSPAMQAFISGEHGNVAFPPEALASGTAERLVHHVDRLVTVSSSAAVAALLAGRETEVAAGSAFAALAGAFDRLAPAGGERATAVARLLAFFANRYLKAAKSWLYPPGALLGHMAELVDDEDPLAPYLDFSAWSPTRLEWLLGLHGTL